MTAVRVDLLVDRGEDWTVQFIVTDENNKSSVLAAPFRMDIKDPYGAIVHSLMTLDEEDPEGTIPGITISEESGYIQLHIPSVISNAIPAGRYYWDLFGNYDDGDEYTGLQVQRFFEGTMTVSERITESF